MMESFPSQFLDDLFHGASETGVRRALAMDTPDALAFATLLSPSAVDLLEEMAQAAHERTLRQFGRVIQLFAPIYVANHCVNACRYCGFNRRQSIVRNTLSLDAVRKEAIALAETGLRHILLLTGEDPKRAGVDYIADCVRILRAHVDSVSIEVFPMDTADYRTLVEAGVDGLTLYQETYDPAVYDYLHPAGPKRNFGYRLDAPERACKAGMRTVGIGALLGLTDWRRDLFYAGLHAAYLQDRYPAVEVGISLPRMRPHTGAFQPSVIVSDRDMVQGMTALRLFLPRAGITISTRESGWFRDHVIRLGVTRMSAGSRTTVGGYEAAAKDPGQFDISDERSVAEMAAAISRLGYQPVYKDWDAGC
ncbi:MAG: 2-iminoacetate synthase ThiH [Deltaproteobacteria bacterium]|nr:MAG: 2-iminoacetate synthase ThiH [Deltaproteobacteria bacterium]